MGTCNNYNSDQSINTQDQSQAEENLIIQQLLERIQQLLLVDEHLACISLCFVVLENLPQVLPLVRESLTLALRNFGESVTTEDNEGKTVAISYYDKALCLYPDSALLRNNLGGFLFKIGHPETAIRHLRYVLSQDPGYLKARENLENICGFLVERWHFRMLNDGKRNSCFRSAIHDVLKEMSESNTHVPLVLDIGTGTGLLSMFAALVSDSVEVYGCEMSPTMYQICGNVLKANGLDHRIHVINKASDSLSIPRDIPRPVDLLVTETFDCAFFGERIIETLTHAWDNLMHENCRIIPAKVTVYVAAIECPAIRRQNRLLMRNLDGVDLSCIEILCASGNEGLCRIYQSHSNELGAESQIIEPEDGSFEPYSSEFLERIPGGYKWLCEPNIVTDFLLGDRQQLKSLRDGIKKTIELTVTASGVLDAFAVWFDLHLSKGHVLTTSPALDNDNACGEARQKAVCWEQAVFPFLSNHQFPSQITFSEDVDIEIGNRLIVDAHFGDQFHLTCHQIVPPKMAPLNPADSADNQKPNKELSDHRSEPCNQATEENPVERNSIPKIVMFMDRANMSAVNDQIYHKTCFNALSKVGEHLTSEGSVLRLVALLSSALFLPIGALKWFEKVLAIGLDGPKQTALQKMSSCARYSADRLVFDSEMVAEVDRSWNVIFADIVDANGCLRENILTEIAIAKSSRLLPGGIVIPSRVIVYGQLINSPTLLEDSRVIGHDRTFPFVVADFINEYQTSSHIGIDLSTLEYSTITDAFEMLAFNLNDDQFSTDSSTDNWKFFERSLDAVALRTATVTSLVYWFELNLVDDLVISTLNRDCHWKQAAVLLPNTPAVNAGDTVKIRTICSDSYFSVDLKVDACNAV